MSNENISAPPVTGPERPSVHAVLVALVVFITLVTLVTVVAYALDLPLGLPSQQTALDWLRQTIISIQSAGWLGIVGIIVLYGLGVVIAAPSALMTYASTLVFGLWAIPITLLGALIGLAMAFFLARFALGAQLQWFCTRYPVTRGIETALNGNGFWIIFLMRQSPIIPFAAQNYMFGILGVRAATYLGASALGIIPGTIAKVYIFDVANSTALDLTRSTSTLVLSAFGIIATLVVMWWVGKAVSAELKAVNRAA